MKRLGVIGGLGPMATVYFMQLITQMSDARTDQEHMDIILHSKPQIPDRTRYILRQSEENPLPVMAEVGKGLAAQGADLIAIPCVTAHYFRRQLEDEIGVPIIDAIEETAVYLEQEGITKAGIAATDGTVACGLLQRSLESHGISCVLPGQEGQRRVMRLIYEDIKAGRTPDLPSFEATAQQLFREGAQAVLLACTELSLIRNELGSGFLDILEVLARKSVLSCGRLKKDYDKILERR